MQDQTTDYSSTDSQAPTSGAYRFVEELLTRADVKIGGSRPWDLQFHHRDIPERVLAHGSLGLGEAYMDGAWDARRLDEFFYRALRAGLDRELKPLRLIFHSLKARLFNQQSVKRAWQVGEQHYDL
ncbi:MAG: hypothetical protein M0Q95_21615, partial [Porticoccaceae bacterium]|nr:hypothetical protein [Porticoccaceae bacterium]